MQSNPSLSTLAKFSTISHFLQECADQHGDKTAFAIFRGETWQTLSYRELNREARVLASTLSQAGLQKGQTAALIGDSNIEWVKHYFAVLLCGGICVPIDPKLTTTEMRTLLTHAEVSFILVSPAHLENARALRADLPQTPKAWNMEGSWEHTFQNLKLTHLDDVGPCDLAMICYTSGTLGEPKGVMVRTQTLLFQSLALQSLSSHESDDVMLSALPFNHLYGLTGGVFYALRCGIELCLLHELSQPAMRRCIDDRKVSLLLTVPLHVKMMMNRIVASLQDEAGFLGRHAAAIPALRRMGSRTIRKAIGPSLRKIIVGGAILDAEVFDFFKSIGISIFVGYGLTETGPVISTNTPSALRRASVGRAVPGVEVRVDEKTREIWTRGPHVMRGYFKNDTLTSQTLDVDGWFRTGDLGSIDEDGYLFVNGRAKSLIALSSGKKVHPEEVETVIARSEKVCASCVVGLRTAGASEETVVAIVLPTPQELAKHNNQEDALLASLRPELEEFFNELAVYKRPLEIRIRTKPFVMTTSMKIKRDALIAELQR